MNEKEKPNSYKSILKGTSIFGGVQIFQILINLVRGKFVALLLGPDGMGIASLFTSSSNTIQRFSSLGLNLAIVKEVAAEDGNNERQSITMTVVSRLISLTSLLGGIICISLCVPLSRLTFGSSEYWWQFMLLGIFVALSISYTGKLSILQGLHKIKKLSKASIIGGLTGLLVGIPLYYFFGDKGIVPAMIALALAMYVFYSLSLKPYNSSNKIKFSWREYLPTIKKLIGLGLIMMASDLIGTSVTYLINLFIRITGGLNDVGLYQAANSVTNQYSGLVFAAMAMDYFPRLSKAASDNGLMRETVNRQTEIVALIIAPAMTLLILTAPLIIQILLTAEFFPILDLMRWMGLGILMKALAFPLGYISFAKGNKKLFFWLEGITGNLLTLVLSCVLYNCLGLIGLGYALVADNFLCLIIYYVVNSRMYDYKFSKGALGYALTALAFGILSCLGSFIESPILSYSVMSVAVVLATVWCFLSIRRILMQPVERI